MSCKVKKNACNNQIGHTVKQLHREAVHDHLAFKPPHTEQSKVSDVKTSSLCLRCHWKLNC